MNLLSGYGPQYMPSPVGTTRALGAWYGANKKGGLSLSGGLVILTPIYVVFTPWNMDQTRQWLVAGGRVFGIPLVGLVNSLITASGLLEPVVIETSAITNLEPVDFTSMFKPPGVRFTLINGGTFEVGFVASPGTWTGSSKNRDAAVDFIRTFATLRG